MIRWGGMFGVRLCVVMCAFIELRMSKVKLRVVLSIKVGDGM